MPPFSFFISLLSEGLLEGQKLVSACLKTHPVGGPGLQNAVGMAISCRPRALTRRMAGVYKQALSWTMPTTPALETARFPGVADIVFGKWIGAFC